MLFYIRLLVTTFFASGYSQFYLQSQFENGGFEQWENVGSSTEEPLEWSSIKTSDVASLNSVAPKVLFQSTDAHSGSYSIKLENKASFGIVANGTITNGQVHADMNPSNGYVFTNTSDTKWHTVFTDRPDSVVGWYKYQPSGGDKGKVEVILHTGLAENPENGTLVNWVAHARFNIANTTISSWTRFSVPFHYYSINSPQYMLAVLTSGDSTQAANASVAYFDDLEMIYNPVSIEEQFLKDIRFVQESKGLTLYFDGGINGLLTIRVLDMTGRVLDGVSTEMYGSCFLALNYPRGVYLIQLMHNGIAINRKIYIE
jgi:hypothetical protein